MLTGKAERPPIVAADIIGAGVGETVLVVGGSSARSAAGDMSIPVGIATVVGIVDDQADRPHACSPDGEAPRRPGGNFRERNGHTS